MNFKFSWKLALVSLFGNVMMSIGVALCRLSHLGIDPFTSMITGVSTILGMRQGTFQSIFNLVLFVILVLMNRKNIHYLNIGALINMFLLGYMIQFLNGISCAVFGVSSPDDAVIPFAVRVLLFVIGILIITLGCSLYIQADLGTAPYDSLSLYLTEILPVKYSVCRVATDACCFAVGFITGGPVGIATVLFMFGTGPFISFWNKKISEPLVAKLS